MKWGRALGVIGLCTLLPLLAPAGWVHHGPFPDLAVVAVVYLAFAAGPDPAAVMGVCLGLAAAPGTPDPLGQQAFLLGAMGYVVGRMGRSLFRRRMTTQMAVVALAVVAVRLVTAVTTEIAMSRAAMAADLTAWPVGAVAGHDPEEIAERMSSIHGFGVGTVLQSAVLAALGSALAAPPLFAALRASRLLRPFEKTRTRDV